MISEGQVVLFRFPQTDQITGILRPALIKESLILTKSSPLRIQILGNPV